MTTKTSPPTAASSDPPRPGISAKLSRRFWSLDASGLCAEARRRTGLRYFSDPPLQPALSVLTDSLENEANLRPLGRFLMRFHLRGLLETRLRVAEFWKDKLPALDAVRIEKPVFIIGMPRSGSTFLHELLAEHPEYRAPRVWEVMFPVHSAKGGQNHEARRIRKADACLWWFRRLAPRADAVYPMRALTPHECVAIHSYTFMSQEFVSTCDVPGYERFLRSTDLTPAYTFEKRFLQHLQLDGPRQRWVLKSPDHVHALDQLFSVFPDAVILQTHRNPVEVVKSSADLTRVLRGLYGPPGEPDEVLAREARMLAESTERFIQFRDTHPDLGRRFVDIKYTDLVANPLATVRWICERIDTPLTESIARRVGNLATQRSVYRGPRASAEPLAGKLATVLETDRFARYCSRFALSFKEAELNR